MRILTIFFCALIITSILIACGQTDEEKDRQEIMREIKKHTPPPHIQPKTPGWIAWRAVEGEKFKKSGKQVVVYRTHGANEASSSDNPFSTEIALDFEDNGTPEFSFRSLVIDTRDGRECPFEGICIEQNANREGPSSLKCDTKSKKDNSNQSLLYTLSINDTGGTLDDGSGMLFMDNNEAIHKICGNNFEASHRLYLIPDKNDR